MDLVRDPSKIHEALQELSDGRVVALKQVKIYSPVRYVERSMSYVGAEVYILGIYGITVDDKYLGVSLINALIPIDPTRINKVKFDEDEYFEFVFEAGACVFKTQTLVRTDTLVYNIYDDFIAKGFVPWYMNYVDLGRIFDTAQEFADAPIGQNPEVTQLIASMIARDPQERVRYFRTVVKTAEDLQRMRPVFIPLKSVQYAATNTMTKLAGAYFQDGLVSALNNPSTRQERLEALLKA